MLQVTEDTLQAGDRITEVDTPEGEWFTVTRTTSKSYWLDIGYGDEMRLGISPRRVVLRQS